MHRLALAGLTLLLVLLCLATLSWPHSWDHGIFAWIGDAIVHGGMPYREAWDIKGPVPYYVFAVAEWVFGREMWGIRVLDLLILAAGAATAARIVSRLAGPGAAAYTALGLSLQYAGAGYFDTAQPDGWAGVLLLIGLAPLVADEASTSARRAAGSALVLGLCLLIKPTYAVFGAAPAAYVLLGRDLGGRARLRGVLLVAAAFALPAVACLAWFAVCGALADLVDGYLRFNLQQAGAPIPGLDTSFRGAVPRFVRRLVYSPAVMLSLLLAVAAAASLRRDRPRALVILSLATAAAFLTVFVQQRYWNRYQWHAPYMALGVLAGCGAGRLWHARRSPAGVTAARLTAGALGALLLVA
ncbi:MAG TPA: glycosyltransferase family 39 protein, partial [Gemmatimonadales bacterium]|nr:glycosyltransferase family 39 protein [Gemmatimonadales bacterium]